MVDQDDTRASWRALVRRWVGSTTLVSIGVFGFVGSVRLGLGNTTEPGPGLWPGLVSAVIILSALVMGPQPDTETMTQRETTRVLTGLGLLALFIFMFSRMGILIPTFVVLALWLRFLAARSMLKSGVIALASAVALYFLFTVMFHVGN